MLVKAVGKRIIKLIIVIVFLFFAAAFALGIYCNHIGVSPFSFFGFTSQAAAEKTVENMLGVRDDTFETMKDLLESAGVSSTNRDLLVALIAGGKDQIDAYKKIAQQLQDNTISAKDAKEKLLDIINKAKGDK